MATIMLVNDGGLQRMLTKNILKGEGYTVFEFEKAYKALREYDDIRPDLVLLDDELPDRDGMDALTEFLEKDPNAQIVMMIGVSRMQQALEAMQAGAIGHVFQPINRKELLDTVNDILGE